MGFFLAENIPFFYGNVLNIYGFTLKQSAVYADSNEHNG
jgi:hypothetical protein